MTTCYDMEKEKREAVEAGKRALESLRDARNYLDSARKWGFFDLLGGGGITGLIKHSKIGNASSSLDAAREDLRIFQRELKDVQNIDGLQIDIGDFLTFADFFFDGFVADYLVQSRIRTAEDQVEEAIERVSHILRTLEG